VPSPAPQPASRHTMTVIRSSIGIIPFFSILCRYYSIFSIKMQSLSQGETMISHTFHRRIFSLSASQLYLRCYFLSESPFCHIRQNHPNCTPINFLRFTFSWRLLDSTYNGNMVMGKKSPKISYIWRRYS